MAKIQEELYSLKLSKLTKTSTTEAVQMTNETFIENLEAIIQELVDENTIVEVEKHEFN